MWATSAQNFRNDDLNTLVVNLAYIKETNETELIFAMDKFTEVLAAITDEKNRQTATELLEKILTDFPTLETTVKWKQAMFTEHGTFILAFNFSKQHFSVAPEKVAIAHFADRFAQTDYAYTDNIIKITWTQPLDYALIADLITYNLAEKKDYTKFWRE